MSSDLSTAEIRHGNLIACIDLSHGANCISFRDTARGATVLREPPKVGEPDNPFLYGMPILFPVNRISGGAFSFEGRTYDFGINEAATGCHLHGTLHRMPFRLCERTERRVTAVYSAEAGEYLAFPHAFEIRVSHTLSENGLLHEVTVKNRSDTTMPCLLGFHTTFRTRLTEESHEADIRVKLDLSEEYERNMANYLPTGKKPPFDAVSSALRSGTFCPTGTPISRHYRAGARGTVELSDPVRGLAVRYEPDPKLAFRLVYNGTANGFICLEPQTSLANSPNAPVSREEAGFFTIPARSEETFVSRMSIIQNNETE